jgi:hypothetical protein
MNRVSAADKATLTQLQRCGVLTLQSNSRLQRGHSAAACLEIVMILRIYT